MARMYSDPSYGSKKVMNMGSTGALNGTVTSATVKAVHKVMAPKTVTGFNMTVTTAATMIDTKVIIGKSLAGTGAFSAIGTATLTGTSTALQCIDGSVTSTSFATTDQLQVARAAGTETGVGVVNVFVLYTENFVESDS